ncbi:MAG: magnesium and cobalt transport protein CorA, partial [Candidatus Glassbacteria bacterium GWA2_58_10]
SLIDYDENKLVEKKIENIEDCFPCRDSQSTCWINVNGIHDLEVIEKLGRHFNLHPLLLEDVVNSDHRPKLEEYDDYLFIVLKMLYYDEEQEEIKAEQVSLILGRGYVISLEESEKDVFESVRERLRKGKGRIRKLGADCLAHALIDAVVDNYFTVLEKLDDTIEDLEEELLANPSEKILEDIHNLKRELVFLRKSVWPLREVVSEMSRESSELISNDVLPFLRDVQDHTIQVIDTIEIFRDLISSILDTYLSSINNKLNAVMKVLTIIATIFIPLTFISGVYGMNFQYMPELHKPWGYPMALLTMAGVATIMLTYFKRKSWL